MSARRNLSEFALYMASVYKVMFQQDGIVNLSSMPEINQYPCHIYIVCRRPRFTLDENEFTANRESINLRFNMQKLGEFESHDITIPNLIEDFPIRLVCQYPYSEFSVLNVNDDVVAKGKVSLLAQCQPALRHLMNLEVLYVGQSYGDKGSRTVQNRLDSHGTLQQIYADLMRQSPDHEVWITAWSFEEVLAMNFDGRESNGLSETEENERIEEVINTAISEQQRINFTEAALIKYFEPKYNKVFKNNFPDPNHSTYSECYELDLNVIGVQLDTEDLGCQLWSPTVTPKLFHYALFPLHSQDERKSMLDLL